MIRNLAVIAVLCLLLPVPVLAGSVIDLADIDVPIIDGDVEESQFGYSAAVGDIDGDGSLELFVGAPGLPDTAGVMHTGGVYVLLAGDVEDLSLPAVASDIAVGNLTGSWHRGRFGSALAVADFDGDGIDDLAVGAPTAGEDPRLSAGAVALYFGSAGSALVSADISHADPDVVVTGPSSGGRFGSALAAGDVDIDGITELIVAAPRAGSAGGRGPGIVYVFTGASLRSTTGTAPADDLASAGVTGERPGDSLAGMSVADTNGDGENELILGAYNVDGTDPALMDAGRIYVVPVTLLLEERRLTLPEGASEMIDGRTPHGHFGKSISTGDIDYDEMDDVLVSACASKQDMDKIEASGEAFVLFGSREGLVTRTESVDVPTLRSRGRWDLFGLPVLLADLNGDATADILASAQFADGPDGDRDECGEVYVFWGSLRSVMAAKAGTADIADRAIVGRQTADRMGASLIAIDLMGGPLPEIVIGAPDSPGTEESAPPGRGRVLVIPELLMVQ